MRFQILIKWTFLLSIISGCGEIVSYPDVPSVEFKAFNLYTSTDILGNQILLGKLDMDFTDGDGDVGINQPSSGDLPDTLQFNLFLNLYEVINKIPNKIEGPVGELKYRIPYMERIGQNKTLQGTITVDIEYKSIEYDSIFYTFYILDRAFNRSNTDTTRLIIFTGIEL